MAGSGSSFIPQRPNKGKPAAKSFRKVYVLSYVSYLVFFTTIIAVGGIFLYQWSLTSQLKELQQELVAQKNLFSESDLTRVRNLDYRIDTAEQLVNNHASVLGILNALDATIADPIQLLSFNYDRQEDFQQPTLALSARAQEFDEAIFQEQIFDNNEITDALSVERVALTTQPIDPEQLELGVEQVVNVDLTANIGVSEINYTGFGLPANADLPFGDLEDFADFDIQDGDIEFFEDGDAFFIDEADIPVVDAGVDSGVVIEELPVSDNTPDGI